MFWFDGVRFDRTGGWTCIVCMSIWRHSCGRMSFVVIESAHVS